MAGLSAAGFEVYRPAGTYFVQTDIRPLGFTDGLALSRELPSLAGVVAIPTQVFYDPTPSADAASSASPSASRTRSSTRP